jgi:hypothetical protein
MIENERLSSLENVQIREVHWCPECRCRLWFKRGEWRCTRRSCRVKYVVFDEVGGLVATIYMKPEEAEAE